MTQLNILTHLWNHTPAGRRSLEDVIGILGKQLRALGHQIIWDPNNDDLENGIKFATGPNHYNMIVEGFTPFTVEMIARAQRETGARFICLATEEPTEKGFNHGTQREMVMRQETFPDAMKYFDAILHLVPGERVTRWYSQFSPTAYAELGYAPSLIRFDLALNDHRVEPPFLFGFYGSVTPRRLNLLKRLARRTGVQNAVKIMGDFQAQDKRDEAMRHTRVILQIRKFDEMGLISNSRCNTALCCGRPVVAEPHDAELTKVWSEIIPITKSEEEFFQTAILTAKYWRGAHDAQFKRFRNKLPPEDCIGKQLYKLGLVDNAGGWSQAA